MITAELVRKREIERVSQRKRRARLHASGLCIQCGSRNSTGKTRCALCGRGRLATQVEWNQYCSQAIEHVMRWPHNCSKDNTLLDDPEVDAFVNKTIVRLVREQRRTSRLERML